MVADLTSPGSDARPTDPRRALGRLGERLAAAHLERLGYAILVRNVRTRYGEIDLIAFDGRTLTMVEVKTRKIGARAKLIRPDQQPLTWLQPRQRARLRRLAAAWLTDEKHMRMNAQTIRFDAIGVVVDDRGRLLGLDHVEGAW
ncbi:MAG TPA: YraN family protein [Solirubrobacteraceae bacterium]|nr:YraN family protein [Solirubrobacteraceae bacterium]